MSEESLHNQLDEPMDDSDGDEEEERRDSYKIPPNPRSPFNQTRGPEMNRKEQDLELLLLRKTTRNDKTFSLVPRPLEPLPTNPLPRWHLLKLDEKLPMVPAPRGTILNVRNQVSQPLFIRKKFDFDNTDPYLRETPTEYVALHDPHLKYFFQTQPNLFKRLVHLGLLTPNGEVTCSLADLNRYRLYLARVHKLQLTAERERQEDWEGGEKKRIEDSIVREVRLKRSDLRILRRLKILRDNDRRAETLRMKWAEHPSNFIAEKRAFEQVAAKKRRELKRYYVTLRLEEMREAQKKRLKRIVLHIVCEEDFSAKLRSYLCAEKFVNHEADLKSFVENKHRYQEEKVRYHRALVRREDQERRCRVENRKKTYSLMAQKQTETALRRGLQVKLKRQREMYLMRKYGEHWLGVVQKARQDGRHQSTWKIRNTVQEENVKLKVLADHQGLTNLLGNIFVGRRHGAAVDPLKNADEETKAVVQEVMAGLVSRTYKDLIESLSNCLVNYIVEEAGKRILDYVCREGIDPRDLRKPTVPVRKRNQIRLKVPQRPCTGPCAQFGRGSDWIRKCGQMTAELDELRDQLKKTLKKKLIGKLRGSLKDDDDWDQLRKNIAGVESSTDIDTAIDTVAGITMDRVSPNPANPAMQHDFTDFAAGKVIKSMTKGLATGDTAADQVKRMQGSKPGKGKADDMSPESKTGNDSTADSKKGGKTPRTRPLPGDKEDLQGEGVRATDFLPTEMSGEGEIQRAGDTDTEDSSAIPTTGGSMASEGQPLKSGSISEAQTPQKAAASTRQLKEGESVPGVQTPQQGVVPGSQSKETSNVARRQGSQQGTVQGGQGSRQHMGSGGQISQEMGPGGQGSQQRMGPGGQGSQKLDPGGQSSQQRVGPGSQGSEQGMGPGGPSSQQRMGPGGQSSQQRFGPGGQSSQQRFGPGDQGSQHLDPGGQSSQQRVGTGSQGSEQGVGPGGQSSQQRMGLGGQGSQQGMVSEGQGSQEMAPGGQGSQRMGSGGQSSQQRMVPGGQGSPQGVVSGGNAKEANLVPGVGTPVKGGVPGSKSREPEGVAGSESSQERLVPGGQATENDLAPGVETLQTGVVPGSKYSTGWMKKSRSDGKSTSQISDEEEGPVDGGTVVPATSTQRTDGVPKTQSGEQWSSTAPDIQPSDLDGGAAARPLQKGETEEFQNLQPGQATRPLQDGETEEFQNLQPGQATRPLQKGETEEFQNLQPGQATRPLQDGETEGFQNLESGQATDSRQDRSLPGFQPSQLGPATSRLEGEGTPGTPFEKFQRDGAFVGLSDEGVPRIYPSQDERPPGFTGDTEREDAVPSTGTMKDKSVLSSQAAQDQAVTRSQAELLTGTQVSDQETVPGTQTPQDKIVARGKSLRDLGGRRSLFSQGEGVPGREYSDKGSVPTDGPSEQNVVDGIYEKEKFPSAPGTHEGGVPAARSQQIQGSQGAGFETQHAEEESAQFVGIPATSTSGAEGIRVALTSGADGSVVKSISERGRIPDATMSETGRTPQFPEGVGVPADGYTSDEGGQRAQVGEDGLSGDWNRCLSQRASEVVRAALCAACGKLHATPGPVASVCNQESKVASVANVIAKNVLSEACALIVTDEMAADGDGVEARPSSQICDESVNVALVAGDIARMALDDAVRRSGKTEGRICDESINVNIVASQIARDALEDACAGRAASKTHGGICDESINVESVASEIANRALEGARGIRKTAEAGRDGNQTSVVPSCDETEVNSVASELARRAMRQACKFMTTNDTTGSVSGDWTECISKAASGLVHTGINDACVRKHNKEQFGVHAEAEHLTDRSNVEANRALDQARLMTGQQPPTGKGHVRIASGDNSRRDLEMEPSRASVYINIPSEESMMSRSTAEILLAPRMFTRSEFARELTSTEIENMTYNVESSPSHRDIGEARGRMDVHEGMTRAIPSLAPSRLIPAGNVEPPGETNPADFRHPGDIYPAAVRTEVQAQLRLIRAEVDQLTRTLREAGVLEDPPAPPRNP